MPPKLTRRADHLYLHNYWSEKRIQTVGINIYIYIEFDFLKMKLVKSVESYLNVLSVVFEAFYSKFPFTSLPKIGQRVHISRLADKQALI